MDKIPILSCDWTPGDAYLLPTQFSKGLGRKVTSKGIGTQTLAKLTSKRSNLPKPNTWGVM